jgi:hypothetical protein
MNAGHWRNDTDRVKLNYWDKFCTSSTLSTINPTLIDLELNPDLRSEIPATNCPVKLSCLY